MHSLKALRQGHVIHHKYEIESLIGSGGFSAVYKATQLGMDRPVALKLMRPNLSGVDEERQAAELEEFTRRFAQEAKVLSKLRSAATVTVYDYGKSEEGFLYMALEFVDGRPLSALGAADMPMAPRRVQRILEQALESLNEAHFHGILHRDLKPANIMLYDYMEQRDLVKLLDFGIAKLFGDQEQREDLTQQNMLIGTPRYMSPEMVYGDPMSPGSDIYSIGLVAYELLVGKPAVNGPNSMAILTAQTSPTPILLPENLVISQGLREVIERMVAKDPTVRYASAEQVLSDLRRLERGERIEDVGATAQMPRPKTEPVPALVASAAQLQTSEPVALVESTDTMRRRSGIMLDEDLDFGSAPEQPNLLQERSWALMASWILLSVLILMITLMTLTDRL